MESEFADIVAKTVDGVVVVDRDLRFTYVNERAGTLLGRPVGELLGMTYDRAFPEFVGGAVDAACRQAARDQQFARVDAYHAGWDRWFEVRIYPSPHGLTVFFTESTERKRAEAGLRESEARLVRAQSVAHVGSWELDLTVNVMWGSREAFRIYGLEYTGPELPFGVVRLIPIPESRVRLDAAMDGLLRRGDPYDLEFQIRRHDDGALRTMHSVAEVERDPEGRPIRVVGTIQDITERVAADEERARLIAAIDQASDAIVLQRFDGTATYANRSFCRLYGYDAAEIVGHDTAMVQGPGMRSLWTDLLRRLSEGEVWTGTLLNRRRDGTAVEVEATVSPVRGEHGEVASIVQVHRDVSTERRLEARMQEIARLEAVGQLAGGIAHDFNNLMTAVRGYADLVVLNAEELDVQSRVDLGQIIQAADRAAGLTRQLLAFGRRQILEPRVLDVADVIADIVPMLRRLIGEHIEIAVSAVRGWARVRADPSQLDQVLVNLAVNARDAMPEGGILAIDARQVDVDPTFVGAHPEAVAGQYVGLSVSDTGVGMDEATRARIFEPFFTTKEPGRGTGMGLATVYGIVRQSGGWVDVYSEPGHGSSFKVYLPLVEEPATVAATLAGPDASGNETILLVEDDDAVRTFATRALSSLGYAILAAGDGPSAIDLIEGRDVDLLVSDVVMPGMSGRELAERLQAARPGLPVLFVSGFAENHFGRSGILPEDAGFLPKPFSTDALARAVRRILDGRRA